MLNFWGIIFFFGEDTKREINYIYGDIKRKDDNSVSVAVNVSERMVDPWLGIKEALRVFTLFTLKHSCGVPSHLCANAFWQVNEEPQISCLCDIYWDKWEKELLGVQGMCKLRQRLQPKYSKTA